MITLAFLLATGIVTGMFLNCLVLAALCTFVCLATFISSLSAGPWQSSAQAIAGVTLLQFGFALGASLFAFRFWSNWMTSFKSSWEPGWNPARFDRPISIRILAKYDQAGPRQDP
jgi:hypothetical protein